MTENKKVAIITGASQGIGKAVAQELLKQGFHVVFTSRQKDKLLKAIEEVGEDGKNAIAVSSDVSNPDSVSVLFKETIQTFGRLDFLFNNAGVVAPPKLLEDITYAEWKSVIDINLTGAFLCTQEAIRIMKRQNPQGGRILNNGSVSAQVPRALFGSYTASKHAMTGLTKATSLEGRDFNIACGQIDIGNVAGEFSEIIDAADASKVVQKEARMSRESICKMVALIPNLPLEDNVLFTTILANKMPFVGRG